MTTKLTFTWLEKDEEARHKPSQVDSLLRGDPILAIKFLTDVEEQIKLLRESVFSIMAADAYELLEKKKLESFENIMLADFTNGFTDKPN